RGQPQAGADGPRPPLAGIHALDVRPRGSRRPAGHELPGRGPEPARGNTVGTRGAWTGGYSRGPRARVQARLEGATPGLSRRHYTSVQLGGIINARPWPPAPRKPRDPYLAALARGHARAERERAGRRKCSTTAGGGTYRPGGPGGPDLLGRSQ